MRDRVCICAPRYLNIGKGALNEVAETLGKIGQIRNPLIVTDKVMVGFGMADRVQQLLKDAGLRSAIFDEVLPDPTDAIVLSGIAALEEGGHDAVIGLGGGSPLDTGKAIAVMANNSRDIQDYRPPKQFNGTGLPMIAIPTTAGTGSEVTHHTVIIHTESREKISCRGEGFVPTAAVIDFELSLSKPKRLIADNALDTLTHAIEAYVSRKATLFSDRLALDCMRLIAGHLDTAYKDPEDVRAREALMLAATFGGLAFSNASIALVHAMSRPLGSLFHVPHGMSNAMLLPTVTDYSKDAATGRYADCARALGLADETAGDEFACDALVTGLFEYNSRLEVPTLSEFGLAGPDYQAAMEKMADDALQSGAPANNPKIADQKDITDLYRKVWLEGVKHRTSYRQLGAPRNYKKIDQGGKKMTSRKISFGRRAFAVAALSAFCFGTAATLSNAAVAQDKIRWKVQSTFNTGWPALGDPIARVSKMLNEATDGRINLKVYEPGKIVPPLEISPSISRGDLPAAYNYLAYDQGRIPSAVLFSAVPFGMEPQEYAAWWFEDEGAQLAADLYHKQNIHPLLCSTIGPETAGWFRKPITQLSDLDGLKIRFSGLGGMVLNRIGASATLMAGGEIFGALEKGTLDATEYSMPAIDEILGFYKIAKYNLFPGWHQPSTSTHLLINLDKWNGLSKSDQALFEMACTAATLRALTTGEALQGAQINSFAEKGVTAAKLPDDVIAELKRVADEIMLEEAAKDADFARIWESQQAFHAQYQVWKEWGYLPRDFK